MKQCPECGQVYTDENLNLCLTDGAPVSQSDSQATVVVPQPLPPPKKKSRTLLWVGLVLLVILAGIIGFAGLLMYLYSGSRETANANNQNRTNTSTPKPSATAKLTPSPSPTSTAAAEPSSTADSGKPTPQNTEIDEVTPISWGTSASTFKGNPGQIYKFQCPPKGTAGAVW